MPERCVPRSDTIGSPPPHRRGFRPADLTGHAWVQMCARGLSLRAIRAVLQYGRIAHVRGAVIHAIGRNEVAAAAECGIDLDEMEGLHVVCAPNGAILTVYRNHDFRGLRPGRRGRSGRRRPAA